MGHPKVSFTFKTDIFQIYCFALMGIPFLTFPILIIVLSILTMSGIVMVGIQYNKIIILYTEFYHTLYITHIDIQYTVYIAQHILYIYNIQYTLHSIHFTYTIYIHYTVYIYLYTLQCVVYRGICICIQYTVYSIHYTYTYTVHSMYQVSIYTIQQGSPAYGPRAKCGPLQKNNGPFQIPGGKEKRSSKKFGENW